MTWIERKKDYQQIKRLISIFPVTAILGPRQCGKTSLARRIDYAHFFDLENPRHIASLDQAQLALEDLEGMIVIDEIQLKPDLFPLLRHIIDTHPKQKYVILGSASRDLIRQSSESLAGRIAYYYLGGLSPADVGQINLNTLWIRGGLPPSFLAKTEKQSRLWREQYITTFLERDIPQLGLQIPARTLRQFWMMLSHYHGQIVNYSELGRSFGISDVTIKKYCDILEGTFMVRTLQPWFANVKKRLVKRPKIYLRDSGLLHSLLSIDNLEQLTGNPKLGASWEGFALEIIIRSLEKRDEEIYFYNTHSGAELDLFWQDGGKNWGIEFKYQDAPRMTKSLQSVMRDLNLAHLWVVYPGKEAYKLSDSISVIPLRNIGLSWSYPKKK